MKKILALLLLTFSLISFGSFSDEELEATFGTDETCLSIGTGFLAISLMDDNIVEYEEERYNKIQDGLIAMGEIFASETDNMSPEEALVLYYATNCKLPSQSKINSFDSSSFSELMAMVKELRSLINQ